MLAHRFVVYPENITKETTEMDLIHYHARERLNMTIISDDFMLNIYDITKDIGMYWHGINRIESWFAYHGITILDNIMANDLKVRLLAHCHESEDLAKLLKILDQAITEKKYVMHCGI